MTLPFAESLTFLSTSVHKFTVVLTFMSGLGTESNLRLYNINLEKLLQASRSGLALPPLPSPTMSKSKLTKHYNNFLLTLCYTVEKGVRGN